MAASGSSSKTSQFVLGGLAGMMATSIVQPIDLIKTRMQLSGEMGVGQVHRSSLSAVASIIRQEGFFNLYNGLSAALLRQATYTSARMGFYNAVSQQLSVYYDGKPLPFYAKVLAGSTAGALAGVVGCPAEVVLIRMTADGRLPVDQRRNYKNCFDAIARIAREEGVLVLWRGVTPTVLRAMILNAAQLASYSQAKQMLLQTSYFKDNLVTHFSASLISGLISTLVSCPVDITKTRIQTQKFDAQGRPQYRNFMDCLFKTVRNEGFFSLWKGAVPYFFRLGPHTILTFIFLENLTKWYNGKK